ncbi:PqqD family peptide modification chaperone [Pseudodesulfovibrio sp. JC047]|uniref:PqqD family protein n=1 Tax=Pseudodesulfovibrio sp. JC047 TaxID=2683199 RepID=UPI0013D3CFD8|nr:PqqD family protein [Pseudodesulfovibrio sp. JC047]NDV19475.1 PqqD family peptide modification chaperone [Pseudodesulfovibrio sp. JC047]
MLQLRDGCSFFRRETYGPGEEDCPNRITREIVEQRMTREGAPKLREDFVPRSNPSVFWRTEHFGAVVFRVTDNTIFGIDETSTAILKLVDETRTMGEILDMVCDETRLSRDFAATYVSELQARGLFAGLHDKSTK